MANNNNELLQRLLATFRIEADEHVKAMYNGLFALEKSPDETQRAAIIETIFRQAHSLKGAARAVKFSAIESICHPLESICAALRDGHISLSASLGDMIHQALGLIESLVNDPAAVQQRQMEVTNLVRQLERTFGRGRERRPGADKNPSSASSSSDARPPDAVIPNEPLIVEQQSASSEPPTKAMPTRAATVRISSKKLDAVMRLSEEMLGSRLAAAQRATDIEQVAREVSAWRKRSADRYAMLRPIERSLATISLKKTDIENNGLLYQEHERYQHVEHGDTNTASELKIIGELRKLLDKFADEQIYVRALEDQLTGISRAADRDRRVLAAMTYDMQQRIREMQLLPCATLLEIFARQARELAREQGKVVDLTTQGSDIEVDRRLLDEIKDPLTHLVRNCIDHGIEKSTQRQKANKPIQGKVSVSIDQKNSGKITITVIDDGAGIDIERLKSLAVSRNLISHEVADKLSATDALDLIYTSGLSTSALITDVSGRGLGMAIVRDKIEQLGGNITVTSTPGEGTCFQIDLPVHLATFRGTLVAIADEAFIVPSASVDRVVCVESHAIHSAGNCETVSIDGQALALVWLSDVLQLPRRPSAADNIFALVLGRGTNRIALRVDAVIGEQEVLVKGLGPQLRRVRHVTGASVLGNGQVVPVLNATDLLVSATQQQRTTTTQPIVASDKNAPRSILVAEDSITSRALMKNILEAAGFRVVTAVDGIDAFTTLKLQHFDLLVSDVDMPRMDGFDLTAKLRADKTLSEIPVVLVTTLDSSEHRERGIDAGANAYIVKSSFDQSNLLEIIDRLI
jgi:two-component system chemotaxis sensor kinase CheA